MDHIKVTLDTAINSFQEDIKGSEVKPNDKESVISDMNFMADFDHDPDTPTSPLSNHPKSHTDRTWTYPSIDINPDAQSLEPQKDPTESNSQTHTSNKSLDPHFNLP